MADPQAVRSPKLGPDLDPEPGSELSPELRKRLERCIDKAHEIAERGARVALEALDVHCAKTQRRMSQEQEAFRQKLIERAHSLGERWEGERRDLTPLIRECAYEYWHGMLFARFLAENHLLIEPESGASVSLEECVELGAEAGRGKWMQAAHYAHRMLRRIFRPDKPTFQVSFAREDHRQLEDLVERLAPEIFVASDALGWVYQYWQSKEKKEVNDSGKKIGAEELPAVTQLFTEPYMVAFLLDNSLGAWWAARRLSEADRKQAKREEELRRKAAIPGVPLQYLRFARGADGAWEPAAGAFPDWPERLQEFKLLDPCCGSGHFLVAAFRMLVPMRMEMEDLSAAEAIARVSNENLHGLEIDPRCVELAVFALALAAWRYLGAGGPNQIKQPNFKVACSGLPISDSKEAWSALAGTDRNLGLTLEHIHTQFKDAPLLGSLIDPEAGLDKGSLFEMEWKQVFSRLEKALAREEDKAKSETGIAAKGLLEAATFLADRYHLVTTNVPYLVRDKQTEKLMTFCERHYPEAKRDLATTFLDRCLSLCKQGGTVNLVLPQNWLFLSTYKNFREKLLREERWHLVSRLGAGAFGAISGEVVKVILVILGHSGNAPLERVSNKEKRKIMRGLDVSERATVARKATGLLETRLMTLSQTGQLNNPDARVILDEEDAGNIPFLAAIASGWCGVQTYDYPYYGRFFWEVAIVDGLLWRFQLRTVRESRLFGGRENILYWEELVNSEALHIIVKINLSQERGVAVSQMRNLFVTLHTGGPFDKNTAVITCQDPSHIPAVWCFCSSPEYSKAVRRIDPKLCVTNATLVKVPFDLPRWTQVAKEQYPRGLPLPHSDDPTQWIFHGHPCGSVVWSEEEKWTVREDSPRTDETVLQVAVARLLGYLWPAELDTSMELAEEARAWVRETEELHKYADEDGIVCLTPLFGEEPAARRLQKLLAAAYGKQWSDEVLWRLLRSVGCEDLEDWLRNAFFAQHCKLFRNRPFIWHIWDGRKRDGFHALVNYHRLADGEQGHRLLEKLIYSYLGDWVKRQQVAVRSGVPGAEDRLQAARQLEDQLKKVLEGEPPYDLFVRWKALADQPQGWRPDVNDGVRLNMRPFLKVDLPGGPKGAVLLRCRPNLHWRIDKGKEQEKTQAKRGKPARCLRPRDQFPWFWNEDKFQPERRNDHHHTLASKEEALALRDRSGGS